VTKKIKRRKAEEKRNGLLPQRIQKERENHLKRSHKDRISIRGEGEKRTKRALDINGRKEERWQRWPRPNFWARKKF